MLQGQDGWLFLGADVSGACEPLLPLEETIAGLDRFGEIVQAAGKTYVFTVAPDKSTMNPDKMPETYVGDDCAPEAKEAFWERMAEDPPVGYVDLKAELERVQEADGENLWRPSDTHWAQRGGARLRAGARRRARPGAVAHQPDRADRTGRAAGRPRRAARHAAHGHRARAGGSSARASRSPTSARRRWPRRRPARRCTRRRR